MYKKFLDYLEEKFTIMKIKKDLHDYLEIKDKMVIASSQEITGEETFFEISISDQLNINSINIYRKYWNQIFIPYYLDVIIGDFEERDEISCIKEKKCRVIMQYDLDFNLITLDFVHNYL